MRKSIFSVVLLMTSALTLRAEGEAPSAPDTPVVESAPAPTVQVERLVLGTSVQEREPVGEAATFDANVERVYCWTLVTSENVPSGIRHVWYEGDVQRADVPLAVNYPRTRTWSYKTVTPGQWRVDVMGDGGVVLSSASFTVSQEAPVAPQ